MPLPMRLIKILTYPHVSAYHGFSQWECRDEAAVVWKVGWFVLASRGFLVEFWLPLAPCGGGLE